jgi:hypothetical protein
MTIQINIIHPRAHLSDLGLLPSFLNENDPRPAAEQFNDRYMFGGWHPMAGFKMNGRRLKYPGDPALLPWAEIHFRDELILVYPGDWVAIVQPDKSFEVCRMD